MTIIYIIIKYIWQNNNDISSENNKPERGKVKRRYFKPYLLYVRQYFRKMYGITVHLLRYIIVLQKCGISHVSWYQLNKVEDFILLTNLFLFGKEHWIFTNYVSKFIKFIFILLIEIEIFKIVIHNFLEVSC